MYRLFQCLVFLAFAIIQVNSRALWTPPQTSLDIIAIPLNKRHGIAVPRDASRSLGIESITTSVGKRDDDGSIQNSFNEVTAQDLDDESGTLSNDDQTPEVADCSQQTIHAAATSVVLNARETIDSVATASNTENEDTAQADSLSMNGGEEYVTKKKTRQTKADQHQQSISRIALQAKIQPRRTRGQRLLRLPDGTRQKKRPHHAPTSTDHRHRSEQQSSHPIPRPRPLACAHGVPYHESLQLGRTENEPLRVARLDRAAEQHGQNCGSPCVRGRLAESTQAYPATDGPVGGELSDLGGGCVYGAKKLSGFETYRWMEDVPTKPPDESCFV